jgi:hypothetical protein
MKQRVQVVDRFFSVNVRTAQRLWPGQVQSDQRRALWSLTERYKFDVATGEVILLNRRWYVTTLGC